MQSVTNTIANYTAKTMKLPCAIANEIDALSRNVLWGDTEDRRKVALVK